MSEHRKNYFLGVSPAQWMTLSVVVIGAAISYGMFAGEVKANSKGIDKNTAAIESVQKQMVVEIQKSEGRTREEIQRSEQRTRDDIRELRGIIIKGNQ